MPYSKSRGFSPLGAGLLLVAVLLLARWAWGLLRVVQWGPRGKRKGRWVRDRGLGGKMVTLTPVQKLARIPLKYITLTSKLECCSKTMYIASRLKQYTQGRLYPA